MGEKSFRPLAAATKNLAVTTSTGSVQVQATLGNARNCRVYNSGSVTVFVEFGGSAVTASTTTGMPVASGATEVFGSPDTYVAAITASGTATVYFTPGEGL